MNEQTSTKKSDGSPRFMSPPQLIGFFVALCVVAGLVGALAKEFDGSLGLVLWLVGWCVIVAAAWIATYKYANPMMPTLSGVIVGLTVPRPSDEWFRQLAGARWGNGFNFLVGVVGVAIGLTIFNVIARRHKSLSTA